MKLTQSEYADLIRRRPKLAPQGKPDALDHCEVWLCGRCGENKLPKVNGIGMWICPNCGSDMTLMNRPQGKPLCEVFADESSMAEKRLSDKCATEAIRSEIKPIKKHSNVMWVNWRPRSLNRTAGQHWATQRKHKLAALEAWQDCVACMIPFKRVSTVALIAVTHRRLDQDNLAAGFKPLRDAVASWMERDDNDDETEWTYGQVRSSTQEGCIVMWQEVRP